MPSRSRHQQELIVTEDELRSLTEKMTMPFKVACYLMYYAGLRISEVHKICWKDIDFSPDQNTILVRQSKNLVTRLVVMHREVRNLLEQVYREQRPTMQFRIVPVRAASAIYGAVKRHAEDIGMPHLHPHSLRHSYATLLVSSGIPLTDVQMLLGHANISTTSRYVHPTIQDIRNRYREKGWL